ncbi:PepSY domain-containing protein [Amorphus sp. 3PC139-8]|uniref:PepSY domain-containing protein n=1 Tax=Amorphus sp. 3PC139-8 TaxID=2735676 RepID=UPI00345DDB23
MTHRRRLALAVFFLLAAFGAAEAQCLSGDQQRQAVQSGQAVRPSSVQSQVQGELIRLDLCNEGGRLVYIATVLGGGGQVSRVVFDARTGARQN